MDKVKNEIIKEFTHSIEAWRGLATTDNMFLIGRIDAREAAVKFVEYAFRTYGEGEWIKTYSDYFFKCSVCENVSHPTTYCPHCGSKNVKVVEDNE